MEMYIQRIKYNGSILSSQEFIIPRLPRFEKLDLSQFQVYIEAQKMTHCFVCNNCKKTIVIRADEGKYKVLYLTHVKDPYWFKEVE